MARLVIILLLALLIVSVIVSVGRFLRPLEQVAPRPLATNGGDSLPDTFKNIAYALLILLMFGVVTGWLGGL